MKASGVAKRELNTKYRDELFSLINEAPFPAHMMMRIVDIDYGSSTVTMSAQSFRMQPFHVMHGGNIAALIDTATFWACWLGLNNEEDGLTSVDLKLNYLAPAMHEAIMCKGRMLKAGKNIFYAEAEVSTDDGRLIAHGTSTLMRMKGRGLELRSAMWR